MAHAIRSVGIVFVAMATAVVAASATGPLDARSARRNRLKLVSVDVDGRNGVALNHVIELRFNARIARKSLRNGSIRIVPAGAGEETPGRPGQFKRKRRGNVVRFLPTLPTHLRDPNSPDGDFYAPGTPQADAFENGSLRPATDYVLVASGGSRAPKVRSSARGALRKTTTATFRTREGLPGDPLFDSDPDVPTVAPVVRFTNPPDKTPGPNDQFSSRGGTPGVPAAAFATLFMNAAPLDVRDLADPALVSFTLVERDGDPTVVGDIRGDLLVDQDREEVALTFRPREMIADRATFALRISRQVRDYTGVFVFPQNAERRRLRDTYDFLAAARNASPGLPPEQLPDPPIDLIFDWPPGPQNAAERGVIKRNILELGDLHPHEVDPSVHLIFTTRDEPVTNARLVFDFNRNDGLEDDDLSVTHWDTLVPGAIAARQSLTFGTGIDGDFFPQNDVTISVDDFPGGVANFRDVTIPTGVTVTLTGSRPGLFHADRFSIDGTLDLSGRPGVDAPGGPPTTLGVPTQGGLPGPGGGAGGAADPEFIQGGAGAAGKAPDGSDAEADVGGRGGGGGTTGTGESVDHLGGGGGGGGARTAGQTGEPSRALAGDGGGGLGGAAATDDPDDPAGGAGGGAGGTARSATAGARFGATGGGGGGALFLKTGSVASFFGRVDASGGGGGLGAGETNGLPSGPGGGGAGGAVVVRAVDGVLLQNDDSIDVGGGPGGTQSGTVAALSGGTGGDGFLVLEDENGGPSVVGARTGTFAPVGAGEPSTAYTNWRTLGVAGAELMDLEPEHLEAAAPPGAALLIEVQFAVPDAAGTGPELGPLDADQGTLDEEKLTAWRPLAVIDHSGGAESVFGALPGYDPQTEPRHLFPLADDVNGKGYKWLRVRVTFVLAESQAVTDPLPFVDQLSLPFQFNR